MKKFNFKRIITMGIAAVMAVSAMSISAFAADETETSNIVIDENTPVGTKFELGNGFIAEVIDEESFNDIALKIEQMNMTRGTSGSWEWKDLSAMGKGFDSYFRITKAYPYYGAVLNNKQPSNESTVLSCWTPSGSLHKSVDVPGQKILKIYSDFPLSAGEYRINFVSGTNLAGHAYGYVGEKVTDVAK